MVWFQCEDCGEDLKKPKLPNHFRMCSASRFSCIDCGVTFSQQNVQSHTQCITEAEKYGPKGQAKTPNGSNAKPGKETKQKPDVDINVGLSERPPWFCRLCNTQATSKQTLLLHAEGKKHRAKARAFHANQQPKQTTDADFPAEKANNGDLAKNKSAEDKKSQNLSGSDPVSTNSEAANGNLQANKKRKLEESEKVTTKSVGDDIAGDGEVIQVEGKVKKTKCNVNKDDEMKSISNKKVGKDTKQKLKWKKLITAALKSSPDGVLKMKKLRKHILKSLRESGVEEDESDVKEILEQKINSSSRFAVDNKYVRLVAKH